MFGGIFYEMKHQSVLFVRLISIYCLLNGYPNAVYSQNLKKADDLPPAKSKAGDTISIIAVGDMMLGSAFPSKKDLAPNNAIGSFKTVKRFLKGDVVFGNLEGCFLDVGKPEKCKDIDSNNCYVYRMPSRYVSVFKKAGFNLLSLANNHLNDFGKAGRQRTTELLDSVGIHYAGQINKPYDIFEIDSVRYGFIAFAPNKNTVQLNDYITAKKLIAKVRPLVNILIISFHGGNEGSKHQHVTRKPEIYLKENRGNVYEFAHLVIDEGADIVLGHGPHVTRAVEVYKNKFIAYSLGNFCTYGKFNLVGANGIAPLLNIKLNTNGVFLYADVVSVKQSKIKRLTIDPKNRAFYKIKYLTNIDFPNHLLHFSNKRIKLKP